MIAFGASLPAWLAALVLLLPAAPLAEPTIIALSPANAFFEAGSETVALDAAGAHAIFSADGLYVRDLESGTTRALTAGGDPLVGAADDISSDGRIVLFQTQEHPLLPPDVSTGAFRMDVDTGEVAFIGPTSRTASMSADGAVVAFITSMSLSPTDTDARIDAYLARADGSYLHLSHASDRWIESVSLSADGTRAALWAWVARGEDYVIHVVDTTDGTILWTSPDTRFAFPATISGDGRYVTYGKPSLSLSEVDGSEAMLVDVVVHDTLTGAREVLSRITEGYSMPRISDDGARIVFDTPYAPGVYLWEPWKGALRPLHLGVPDGTPAPPSFSAAGISADGRGVAIATRTAYDARDDNGAIDVYLVRVP